MGKLISSKTILRQAVGLGAIALTMMTPLAASAQDRGGRGDRQVEGQAGRVFENRGERGEGMRRQWQQRERPQVQAQQQAAPGAPAQRQGWDGRRSEGWRADRRGVEGQQSGRSVRGGPDTRGWTPQQWEAYRGAVLEGRDTDAFRNQAARDRAARDQVGRARTWQTDRQDWRGRDARQGWRDNDARRDNDGRRDGNWRDNDRRSDDWRRNTYGQRGNDGWRNNGSWRGNDGWRNDRGDNRRWDRGWRSNNRYDWSSYRARNRSVFQAGRYYSPYRNYSYRRLNIGFSLGSSFYGSRYWINDPYSYRLPEVYGPYRWVRYYDDVLLVDIYSGEVVDAIYDFFW